MSRTKNEAKDVNIADIKDAFDRNASSKPPRKVAARLGGWLAVHAANIASIGDTREKGSWRHTPPVVRSTYEDTQSKVASQPVEVQAVTDTQTITAPSFTSDAATNIPEFGIAKERTPLWRRVGNAMLRGYKAVGTIREHVAEYRELLRPSPKVLFMAAGVLAVAGVVASVENHNRNRSA